MASSSSICEVKSADQIFEILSDFQDALPILGSSTAYRKEMAEKLSKYAFVFLLQIDHENAGFASIYANDTTSKTGYISFIAIASKYRKMHLGTQLMNTLFSAAKQNQMQYVKLEVAKTNTVAQSFYSKYGFQYQSEASADSIYMIKQIDD